MNFRTVRLALLLALAVALLVASAGCGHPTLSPQFADLTTENVTIRTVDGSWSLSPGEPIMPPLVDPLSAHDALQAVTLQKNLDTYNHPRYADSVIDVIVEVGGREQLHGKLFFSNVYKNAASGSAKRKWTVTVPETYLNIARQGNVAVVYQPYAYNNREWASWVLWMSKLPL